MMSSGFVVDTSVLIATVAVREPRHREAREFMEHWTTSGFSLVVPAIALAEFAAGLSRSGRTPPQVRRFLTRFHSHSRFVVSPVSTELGETASEIAMNGKTRGCDSVFLALARTLALPLVTLDREQLARAPADVEVFTPEQALARWRRAG